MSIWIHELSKIRSRQNLYEFLESEFSKIEEEANVLTIGSGGEINKRLETYRLTNQFTVTSFDIDEKRGPDIKGDICTYNFENRKFDYVVLSEVLQFLQFPHKGIQNIHSILKPEGKLILTSPFLFPLHDRPFDLYRFTKHGLEFLLSDFEKVSITERNSAPEAIDVLWMRMSKIKSRHTFFLKRIIVFTTFYFKRPLSLLLSKFIKTDIITTGYNVVAQKSNNSN